MHVPRFFTEPFRLRTWKETAYALLALPLGVAWFTIFLTLGTTSLSLIVFVVGVPLLALTLWLARIAARVQRAVAGTLLDASIPDPPSLPVPADRPWWRRLLEPVLDLATWRALVYLLLFSFPLGLGLFIAAVVLWSVALSSLASPIWHLTITEEDRGDVFWNGNTFDSGWEWAAIAAGGLVLVFVTPWIIRALTSLDVILMRALLGPTRGELERAAAKNAEQRDFAVASATGDRRQIERDLHDGAQARLVSLAVDLGRARRRLEEGGADEAAELVRSAHEESKRLWSRSATSRAASIPPSSPTAASTQRSPPSGQSPVEVTLRSELGPGLARAGRVHRLLRRRGGADERRAAREATRAAVSVVRDDGVLVVEVRDDGVGGAEAAPGSGLAGLRDRVGALGGTLVVESPPGGPTAITAVLPCA